jgi:hypothetical protein
VTENGSSIASDSWLDDLTGRKRPYRDVILGESIQELLGRIDLRHSLLRYRDAIDGGRVEVGISTSERPPGRGFHNVPTRLRPILGQE